MGEQLMSGGGKKVMAGRAGRMRAGDTIQEERDSESDDDDNEDRQQASSCSKYAEIFNWANT